MSDVNVRRFIASVVALTPSSGGLTLGTIRSVVPPQRGDVGKYVVTIGTNDYSCDALKAFTDRLAVNAWGSLVTSIDGQQVVVGFLDGQPIVLDLLVVGDK